jgi:hypothetical protein
MFMGNSEGAKTPAVILSTNVKFKPFTPFPDCIYLAKLKRKMYGQSATQSN